MPASPAAGGVPANPLRILHITTTIDRGGAENHLAALIQGQVAKGATVDCAYLKGKGELRGEMEARGVQVVDLQMSRYGAPGPFFRFRKLIKAFNPDIVHAHGAPAELYAMACTTINRRRRPKLLVTRHEHRVRLFGRPGYAMLDRRIGQVASVVLAVSQAVLETDAGRQPSLRAKSRVVHHGIDPAPMVVAGDPARRRIREDWRIAADTILIGSVARLSPEKSLETLLEGFAQLVERNMGAPKLALALVGLGPSEAELRALAGSLNIADKVIFAGRRDDIPSVLNAFDIFVLPSVYEGFGLAVLEAMAAGLPVIASRIGAFEEIVVGGETGRLFELRNPQALADELEALVRNPDSRRTFGANGLRRVEQDFSLEAMHAKTWNAYLDAIAG